MSILEQTLPWNKLGGDIQPILNRLDATPELVIFESNEPKMVLLSIERYQALTQES